MANISSTIAIWIYLHLVWISFEPCQGSLPNYSTVDKVPGCSITNTYATCESQDLNETVSALPSFITNLHVSLYGENYLYPGMFDRFNNITEIDIFSPNQTAYYQSSLYPYYKPDLTDEYLKNPLLKILRLKLAFKFDTQVLPTSFRWLKNLEVLDFTRAAFISIQQFATAFYTAPTILPLKSLILTNVQGLDKDDFKYSGFLNFSALVCPFRVTLEVLDLRYNDITYVYMDSPSCVTKLRYLDLRHNLLTNVISENYKYHRLDNVYPIYIMFAMWTVEVATVGHQWKLEEYHEGLWDADNGSFADSYTFASGHNVLLNRLQKDNSTNDKSLSATLENQSHGKSNIMDDISMNNDRHENHDTQSKNSTLLRYKPYDKNNRQTNKNNDLTRDDFDSAMKCLFTGMLGFEIQHSSIIADLWPWIKSVKDNCPGIIFNNLPTCAIKYFLGAHNRTQQCLFFMCMIPSLEPVDLELCSRDIKAFVQADLFHKACNYKHCFLGIPIPLPSTLREVELSSISTIGIKKKYEIRANGTVLCFFEKNNLLHMDASYTQLLPKVDPILWRSKTISGLHRLTFLNFQNCQAPFVLNKELYWDMPSLEELHTGGNKFSEDNSVPEEMFRENQNLLLLNLSYSGLVSIPNGTFLNARNLTVLDLSHNSLSAKNLTFTISHTKLERLDLQDNQLNYLPIDFCQQLDLLGPPLQVDLSDNLLQCDCHTIQFIKWIQAASQRINFTNAHTYMCSSKEQTARIFSFDVQHLRKDCSQWRLPVIASASTLAAMFLVATVILLHRKRWAIRHFLFVQRERFENVGSEENVHDYRWDAFILYSSENDDRRWVHFQLVEQLEKNFGFKLFFEHRDFPLGFDYMDNVEMGIRNSRKVVAILSPNFLDTNSFCTASISMACNLDPNKLIFVMYRPLPLDEYIPAMLTLQLALRTYLEWDEEPATAQTLFWKRLTKALYEKPKRHE